MDVLSGLGLESVFEWAILSMISLPCLSLLMRPHGHTRTIDGKECFWAAADLWRLSEALPITWVDPATIINLDYDGWFKQEPPTARAVLAHMKRILDADLSKPIILCPEGTIMDGAHRACKALLLGEKAVPVRRFAELPGATGVEAPPAPSLRSRWQAPGPAQPLGAHGTR